MTSDDNELQTAPQRPLVIVKSWFGIYANEEAAHAARVQRVARATKREALPRWLPSAFRVLPLAIAVPVVALAATMVATAVALAMLAAGHAPTGWTLSGPGWWLPTAYLVMAGGLLRYRPAPMGIGALMVPFFFVALGNIEFHQVYWELTGAPSHAVTTRWLFGLVEAGLLALPVSAYMFTAHAAAIRNLQRMDAVLVEEDPLPMGALDDQPAHELSTQEARDGDPWATGDRTPR